MTQLCISLIRNLRKLKSNNLFCCSKFTNNDLNSNMMNWRCVTINTIRNRKIKTILKYAVTGWLLHQVLANQDLPCQVECLMGRSILIVERVYMNVKCVSVCKCSVPRTYLIWKLRPNINSKARYCVHFMLIS